MGAGAVLAVWLPLLAALAAGVVLGWQAGRDVERARLGRRSRPAPTGTTSPRGRGGAAPAVLERDSMAELQESMELPVPGSRQEVAA